MRRLKRAHQKYIKEQIKRRRKFKSRYLIAGSAAAITFGSGVLLNIARADYTPDPHELVVSQDADADLLANKEELSIGYSAFRSDQNNNGIPDCVELAKRCAADINELPEWSGQGKPPESLYKRYFGTWGTEECDVCSQLVNMGGWEIVNPQLGLGVDCPLIAIHYMEHGSFDCLGSVHQGRVNLQRLMAVLELHYPYEPNEHQLAIDANDLDSDLLYDSEELAIGLNMNDADQDDDLTPDGIELAKQCAAIINELPWEDEVTDPNETYKWCQFQKGLETCDICGVTVNMGPAGIVNPELGLSVDCPLIAIHYMEHGSFEYAGDVRGRNRIDVATLVKVLGMPRSCGDLGTVYMPDDLNKDCKVDFADFADIAKKWLASTDPNDDGDVEY